jgi:formate dehydrogenase major subunit
MAECHPVAFRWVMQAKTRDDHPCTVIHVDPRFTRTSAMANVYAPLRAGADIVFLGGLIKYVLDHHEPIFRKSPNELTPRERFFRDYVVRYTNAATLITEDYKDTEDDGVSGLFSGFDEAGRKYDVSQWRYDREGDPAQPPATDASFAEHIQSLVQPPAKKIRHFKTLVVFFRSCDGTINVTRRRWCRKFAARRRKPFYKSPSRY